MDEQEELALKAEEDARQRGLEEARQVQEELEERQKEMIDQLETEIDRVRKCSDRFA